MVCSYSFGKVKVEKVWRPLAGMSRGLVIRWEAANEAGTVPRQKGWLQGEAAWQYLGMGGTAEHSTLSMLLVGLWQIPVGKQTQIPQDRSFLLWQPVCLGTCLALLHLQWKCHALSATEPTLRGRVVRRGEMLTKGWKGKE